MQSTEPHFRYADDVGTTILYSVVEIRRGIPTRYNVPKAPEYCHGNSPYLNAVFPTVVDKKITIKFLEVGEKYLKLAHNIFLFSAENSSGHFEFFFFGKFKKYMY